MTTDVPTVEAAPSSDRLFGAIAAGLLAATLLFAAGIATTLSWNRNFQIDEVEHLHAAYHVAEGRVPYRDFWQGHNPLLYGLLAPLISPDDPVASFRRGRAFAWVVFACTLCAIFGCARTLSGRAEVGWLAAGLLLLHTTFVERGLEVRPDGLLALGFAVALWCELRGAPGPRRHAASALALSLAFLATQKAVFGCFAFGCLWLARAARERRPGLVAWPMLVWTTPVALAALWLVATGAFQAWLEYNVLNQAQVVGRAALTEHTFGVAHFGVPESLRNLFFVLAAAAGLGQGAWRVARREADAARLAFPFAFSAFLLASLWAQPSPFPYMHVHIAPFLALCAALALGAAAERWLPDRADARLAGVCLCLLLAAATSVPRLWSKLAPTNSYQFAMLREVDRITEPDDAYFDLAGLAFRPDGYPVYLMTGMMMGRYKLGGFPPIIPSLRERETVAVGVNYRTSWLPEAEMRFLHEHFTHYAGNLYVLGRLIPALAPGEEQHFEVLKRKEFLFEGSGRLSVDGRPFERGVLDKGVHVLRAEEPIRGARLILATPEPRPRETIPHRPVYMGFD